MKHIFGTLLLLLSWAAMQGAIITVDNSPTGGGQFDDLQLALDAANEGDTIHLVGSGISYGNAVIRKQIYLIGTGYNPPFALAQKAFLSSINLNQDFPLTTAAGTVISGLEVSTLSASSNINLSGVEVNRCRISNLAMGPDCDNWLIENNIISNLNVTFNANVLIRNNIIQSAINSSDQPTVLISNNLFTAPSVQGVVFSNVDLATITNNIFYLGRSPQGATNCVFSNNMSFGTNDDTFNYGSNTGSNNQAGVNPMFQNVSGGGYTPEKDWRLANGSPGQNAGTDGTDIGLYGGISTFPIGGAAPFLTSAPPAIPQIEQFTLFNPNVAQGDSLQVFIRARKQD